MNTLLRENEKLKNSSRNRVGFGSGSMTARTSSVSSASGALTSRTEGSTNVKLNFGKRLSTMHG